MYRKSIKIIKRSNISFAYSHMQKVFHIIIKEKIEYKLEGVKQMRGQKGRSCFF